MKGTINIVIEEEQIGKTTFRSEVRVEDVTTLGGFQCVLHVMGAMDMDAEERKLFALALLSGALDGTHISSETTDLSAEGGAEA